MIRKGQVEEIQCVLSEVEFINKIMGIAAWYSDKKDNLWLCKISEPEPGRALLLYFSSEICCKEGMMVGLNNMIVEYL